VKLIPDDSGHRDPNCESLPHFTSAREFTNHCLPESRPSGRNQLITQPPAGRVPTDYWWPITDHSPARRASPHWLL